MPQHLSPRAELEALQAQTQQAAPTSPRAELEALEAQQQAPQQSGPTGGPILDQTQQRRLPSSRIDEAPITGAERVGSRVRVRELDREAVDERTRKGEVRRDLRRSIADMRFDLPSLLTAGARVGARLASPEATPLSSRSGQLLMQGGTLGFGDEVEGLARGITQPIRNLAQGTNTSFGEAFSEQVDASRGQLQETRDAAPLTSFALEAAGGGGVGGATAARHLAGATGRGGVALRSSQIGAVTGGIVGAGEAEGGLKERAIGGTIGAAAGGAIGAVSPVAIEGITRTARVMARVAGRGFNRLRGGNQMTRDQRLAYNRILQRAREDGFTADEFQARVDRARELGLDDEFIFEMAGPRLVNLATGGTAGGSEAATQGIARVRARQAATQSRVEADLQAAIGSDGSDFLARSQSILDAQANADPLYARFRELPPIPRASNLTGRATGEAGRAAPSAQTMRLEAFFDNPLFARAAKQSSASALSRNGIVMDIDNNLTPDVLDRIKRTIDEQINTAQRRADSTAVGDLVALSRRYVAFLDDEYPGVYSAARRAYGGPAKQEEALELGEGLIRDAEARRAPEAVTQRVAEMSEDELAAFRVGVARSIVNRIRETPTPLIRNAGDPVDMTGNDPGNQIRAFFNNDARRDVIRAAFGNEQSFTRFAERMATESQRFENFRQINVRQGSQTQQRQDAIRSGAAAAAETAADVGQIAAGSTLPILRTVSRMLRGGLGKDSPAVQEEIQRILFSVPADQRAPLRQALAQMRTREAGKDVGVNAGRMILGPILPAAAGGHQRDRRNR